LKLLRKFCAGFKGAFNFRRKPFPIERAWSQIPHHFCVVRIDGLPIGEAELRCLSLSFENEPGNQQAQHKQCNLNEERWSHRNLLLTDNSSNPVVALHRNRLAVANSRSE